MTGLVSEILTLRAELEAAKCTLDDEIASHQDTLRLWNALRAERAKLEAALREIVRCRYDTITPKDILVRHMARLAEILLAQPAKSGAQS